MRRTLINHYSEKKILEMQAEAPKRIELCKRAGGTPSVREVQIYRKGQKYTYSKVECVGGLCECGLPDCPKSPPYGQLLEPHEQQHRSLGGKLTLNNTILVTRNCHRILQKNEPVWSRNV